MKIYTTTILGSPAAECANFGICQVDGLSPEEWESFRPQHFRHVKAIISLAIGADHLCFEFPFSGMRVDTRKAFFTPKGFRIDTPGRLPDYLAAVLGTDAQIIVQGIYPLVFSTEGVILEVEVRKDVPAIVYPTIEQHRPNSPILTGKDIMPKGPAYFNTVRG